MVRTNIFGGGGASLAERSLTGLSWRIERLGIENQGLPKGLGLNLPNSVKNLQLKRFDFPFQSDVFLQPPLVLLARVPLRFRR